MTRVSAAALAPIKNAKQRSGNVHSVTVVHCDTVVHRVTEEYGFAMFYCVQMYIALH